MRPVLQDGQTARPLQEKAIRKSWPQASQRPRSVIVAAVDRAACGSNGIRAWLGRTDNRIGVCRVPICPHDAPREISFWPIIVPRTSCGEAIRGSGPAESDANGYPVCMDERPQSSYERTVFTRPLGAAMHRFHTVHRGLVLSGLHVRGCRLQ